jgi:putative ABC transport system permease protein
MQTIIQDLRYGFRMLYKSAGFSAVAIITLALGIGATTAIFSVVDAVLLRPLPYANPERLATLWMMNSKDGNPENPVSLQDYDEFRNQNRSFEEMAAASTRWTFNLTGGSEPEMVTGAYGSASLFPALGVNAVAGQAYSPDQDRKGAAPVAVISHALWQRQFGSDPEIAGKILRLSGNPYTITGVLPAGFQFIEEADVWLPMSLNQFAERGRSVRFLTVVGRLKPGVTLGQAQSDIQTIATGLEQQYPASNAGFGARLVGLHKQVTKNISTILFVLLGAVLFVLIIACVNVANLLLARSTARQKEIAIRAALGASRRRIIRQMLTESALLALVGGGAGLLLSFWAIDLLLALSPQTLPRQSDIGLSGGVMAFALGLSLLTGMIFGLAPAVGASKPNLNETLKEGGRSSGANSRTRHFRSALVVTEIALALVLLVGSGLLIRSFMKLLDVNPGYSTENVLTFTTLLPQPKYPQSQQRAAFYRQLEERIKTMPEVVSMGAVTRLPLLSPANNNVTVEVEVEGRPMPEGGRPEIDFRRATTDYFPTMGIPLVSGRMLSEQDAATTGPPVIVINEAMARGLWPGESAIRKRVKPTLSTPDAPWMEVVGVVGNVRHLAIDIEPRPEMYLHYMTAPLFNPIIVVRASGDPMALVPAIRSQVRALDPELSIAYVNTMEQLAARSISGRKFSMTLLGVFAGVAFLLAAVGIYGVISYTVTQRTHEIGIRMALGATSRDVLRMIFGHAMLLAGAGIVVGLVAARALTTLMSSILYEVSAADTVTFAIIPLVIAGMTLLASYIPARRAMKVDPMVALRN